MVTEMRQDRATWGILLVSGIATFLVGLLLVTAPGATTLFLVTLLGAYWLVRGVIAIISIFTGDNRSHWFWSALIGFLGIVAGLIILRHPLYSSLLVPTLLVIILGIDGIVIGIINIARSISGDGFSAALLGIVDIIIGAVLLASPLFAAALSPLILGTLGIIFGIVLFIYAFVVKGQSEQISEEQARQRRAA